MVQLEEIKIIVLDSGRLEQFAHLIPDKLKDIIRESGTIILGAKGPGEVAMGVAVFSEYSHFMDLLWIYVEPEFRGFGIGKAFINRIHPMNLATHRTKVMIELRKTGIPVHCPSSCLCGSCSL